MSTTLHRIDADISLEKRQNIPYVLKSACPKCSEVVERDFSEDHYLSYAALGKPCKAYFSHESKSGRSHEWQVDLVVDLTVRLA